jgi:DMSO/TMAO reductase YedYZ molybdopterin-dependent catalytic subunit
MRRASVGLGLVIGALTSVVLTSVLALGHALAGLPFLPFDVFEWLTRILPGRLLTAAIDLIVSVVMALHLPTAAAAKATEEGLAIVTFLMGSAVLGGGVALALRRVAKLVAGVAAGAVWLGVAIASERTLGPISWRGELWLSLVLLAWGLGLAWAIDRTKLEPHPEPGERRARRRFLEALVGVAATSSGALLAVAALFRRSRPAPVVAPSTGPGAADLAADVAMPGRALPVAGTRAEITPNDRFYRIDIDLEPPRIDASTWRLHVDGLVAAPRDFTIDEIRAMPTGSQIITLECISNRVGGDLISTSNWTGVRLRDFLRLLGASDRARAVNIEAADGFHESVPIAEANDERTLLVHAMNGVPLPVAHGFPLRVYIPNHYGMKQPKWITKMHVSDREKPGYWVERGWSERAIVQTTSVIDTVAAPAVVGDNKVVPVGGIAYSGARGISRVEVQVDEGPWESATLLTPALSPLSWVLWRYDWPYEPGGHTFRVRAYDGTGTLQPTRVRPPHPDGATGIDTFTASA